MPLNERLTSRKFILAMIFTAVGCAGLLAGAMSGSEFIALAGVILGLYGGANVGAEAVKARQIGG